MSSSQYNINKTDEVTARELSLSLKNKEKIVILDVREPFEFDICNIGGILIPCSQFLAKVDTLDKQDSYVVLCHTGIRSRHVVNLMKELGFQSVKNLTGGIHAWAIKVDHNMPTY